MFLEKHETLTYMYTPVELWNYPQSKRPSWKNHTNREDIPSLYRTTVIFPKI